MPSTSLYDRLGGEKKIRPIVTDLLALHKRNPVIATRYNNAKKSDGEIAAHKRTTQDTSMRIVSGNIVPPVAARRGSGWLKMHV